MVSSWTQCPPFASLHITPSEVFSYTSEVWVREQDCESSSNFHSPHKVEAGLDGLLRAVEGVFPIGLLLTMTDLLVAGEDNFVPGR